MTWTAGQQIHHRYELRRRLGDRPGHQVWLATDQQQQRAVVIKILAFAGQIQWDDVKLFEREIDILKQLNHPQIPAFLDTFTLEAPVFQWCLVEGYIHAPSLQAFLNRHKQFADHQIWEIAIQILQILEIIHASSPPILHRDIKPSNILIDAQKKVYLIDFGSAQRGRQGGSGDPPTQVGSYGYTPLEQFSGQSCPASDLYGLGTTLIHLLSGQPPTAWMGADFRIQVPAALPLSAPLLRWLRGMTAIQVSDRYPTAHQAHMALQQALSNSVPASSSSWSAAPDASTLSSPGSPRSANADLDRQPELQIIATDLDLKVEVPSRWSAQSVSRHDLGLLTLLALLPVVGLPLSLIGLQAGPGAGILGSLGLNLLVLLGSCVPGLLLGNSMVQNLIRTSLRGTLEGLGVEWHLGPWLIRRWQWPWSTIKAVQAVPQTRHRVQLMAIDVNLQSTPLAPTLSAKDGDSICQAIEQWRLRQGR
ncbi:serine/threonine protein kinase [Lyngbya confervoides]|uniref:Serine/threonine protein kinase n=1 Tax=Lyngbya confervoides BDU141951 TaxID=1574623 RepID=A0ABD4T0S4_9CYAN|nr:serine/threonine-protein kinase [Lyngbya confervoides]MCM1982307.1 serine/threonine protein kinase [Lyngbya confervoides BDU141951]